LGANAAAERAGQFNRIAASATADAAPSTCASKLTTQANRDYHSELSNTTRVVAQNYLVPSSNIYTGVLDLGCR
jgi:hypothetical protein